MPRRARLHLAGGIFHVVSRFAREERWLDRPGAREAYLRGLSHAARADDAQVLAYCLMSNHVHLVLVQGAAPLSRFMRSVNTAFASWAHASRGRKRAQGPVFADRPRMVLVDREAYLLELVRYVHNNPVRAGVVRHARSSDWSSHQAYLGRVEAPPWLRLGYVVEHFGSGTRAAERFDAFVDAGRKEDRRPELSGARDAGEAATVRRALGDAHRMSDGIIGSERFVKRAREDAARVEVALGSRGSEQRSGATGRPPVRAVIDAVLQALDINPIEYAEKPKSQRGAQATRLITFIWVHEYAGHQVEVARALELETSSISRHYGEALALAGEFDEQAGAVVALLRDRSRARARRRTPATEGGFPVRYHVDVDET